MIKAVKAIYENGKLIFIDENISLKDGTEIIVTFVDDTEGKIPAREAIKALRGRGKGEKLVEKLLESRREDKEHDEDDYRRLRS